MLEIIEKQSNVENENQQIKIIDIFPDNKVVYLYGTYEQGHITCFKKLIEKYINCSYLEQMLQEERLFTIQDYLIKRNHILLLNLTPKFARTEQILVLLQDSTSLDQQKKLLQILENNSFPEIQLCIHNEDNRYGEYHYHETTENVKTLKKRRTTSSLLV